MGHPVTMFFGQLGTGKSIVLEQMMFEETYRVIAPYRKFNKDSDGHYYDGGTEEAWQLWQKARHSPEYVNRPTAILVQDLLKVVEGHDIFEFYQALRERAESFLQMNADKLNNVVVGPWTDGKKE